MAKSDNSHIDPQKLVLTKNIRRDYEDCDEFKALVESIEQRIEAGLEPIVSPISYYVHAGRYYVLTGNRRAAAARMAKNCTSILAVQCEMPATDGERMLAQLVENSMRQDLKPIEKAEAYRKVLDADPELTNKKLAAMVGVSPAYITQYLSLLDLEPELQKQIDDGEVLVSVGYALATKLTHDQRESYPDQVQAAATGNTQRGAKAAVESLAQSLTGIKETFPDPPKLPEPAPPEEFPQNDEKDTDAIKDLCISDVNLALSFIQDAIEKAKEVDFDISELLKPIMNILEEYNG